MRGIARGKVKFRAMLGSQCEGWGESFLGSSLEYNASENWTVSHAVSQSVRGALC
jgi:hypothetical protein